MRRYLFLLGLFPMFAFAQLGPGPTPPQALLNWSNLFTATQTIGTGAAQSQFAGGPYTANWLSINDGSNASPITTAGPTLHISRTENISNAALCGNNPNGNTECNPALDIIVVGGANQVQGLWGLNANVTSYGGTAPAQALNGYAEISGTGTGISEGAYLQGRRSNTTSGAAGLEVRISNNTTTTCDAPNLVSLAVGQCVGLAIAADSGSHTAIPATSAIGVYNPYGTTFQRGLVFGTNSVTGYTVDDESSSTVSVNIGGTHTYAIATAVGAGKGAFADGVTAQGGQALNVTPAPNLLINPGMLIDQAHEGASNSTPNTYTIDGWLLEYHTTNGFTVSAARNTTTFPGNQAASIKVTMGTGASPAASDDIYIAQRLEGDQITSTGFGSSVAQTLSMSFYIQASVTGEYDWSYINGSFNRSFVGTCAVPSANTWVRCTGTIVGDTSAGAWSLNGSATSGILVVAMCTGTTYQTTAGAWQVGPFFSTSNQTQLCTTNGATAYVTGVKLEIAAAATPFVARDFGTDLALAQRYYRKTFAQGTAPAQSAGVTNAICTKNPIALGDPSSLWQFGTSMRATPTITTYNPSAANANWRDVTASADATVSVDPATAVGPDRVLIGTSGTITTLGDVLCIHAVADARL